MFDRVLFIARGHVAYIGPPSKVLLFLEKNGYPCPNEYNPADMVVQVIWPNGIIL